MNNVIEVSNALHTVNGILKTRSIVIQQIRKRFNLNNRISFNRFEIDQNGSTAKIIAKGGHSTLIDLTDVEAVIRAGAWSCFITKDKRKYFQASVKGKVMKLHSFIMRDELAKYEGFTEETGLTLVVHHKDNDGSNNRRSNLEVITQNENKLLSAKNVNYNELNRLKDIRFEFLESKGYKI